MPGCPRRLVISVVADSFFVRRVLIGPHLTADDLRAVHLKYHEAFALAKMLRKGNSVNCCYCDSCHTSSCFSLY